VKLESVFFCTVLSLVGCGNPVPPSSEARPISEGEKARTLKELKAIPVEGHEGLWVEGRSHQLKKCTECHGSEPVPLDVPGKQAHGDVKLAHAKFMECSTCHVSEIPAVLGFGTKRVNLDQSHHLCASCHNTQGEDFILGSHGKRMTGWKGPRVVKSCVACHDPHEPSFKALPTMAHPKIIPDRLKGQEPDHE